MYNDTCVLSNSRGYSLYQMTWYSWYLFGIMSSNDLNCQQ